MTAEKRAVFYGWRNVAFMFVSYGCLYATILYGFGVIFPSMIKSLGWARGDASIAQTIRTLLLGFAAPLCAYFINRWGVRFTIMFGGSLMCIACLVLGTVTDKLWMFILFWGFIVGIGNACCIGTPFNANVTFWFVRRRSLAIGLVMTGGAVFGFLIQPFVTWVIMKSASWQIGWLAVAGVLFVGTMAALWVKNKPADYGQHPDGIDPEQAKAAAAAAVQKLSRVYRAAETWTVPEAIRTRTFWFILLAYTSYSIMLSFTVAHGILHITDLGYTRMQAAYALGFLVLVSGFARLPLGFLADYIEPRYILIVIMVACSFAVWGIWKAPTLTIVIGSTCLYGFCMGAGTVLHPTLVGNYFGPPSFANMNGVMVPINVCCGALVVLGAGYIHDFQKSYDLVLAIILVMCIVSVVGLFFAPPPKKAVGES